MQYGNLFASLLQEVKELGVNDWNKLEDIRRRAKLYIRKAFSEPEIMVYINDLDNISFSSWVIGVNSADEQRYWSSGKQQLSSLLNVLIEDLHLTVETSSGSSTLPHDASTMAQKQVFIVHGHDEGMKQAVARTLEKLQLEPIILHEQPNMNRTIIEKFEAVASLSSFAVILLSPDDMAYSKSSTPDKAGPRARQNVILELGFFVGKLGRDHVFVLYKEAENFELPSDYTGVLYEPYDSDAGKWRFSLVGELQAVGYDVSADSLLKK